MSEKDVALDTLRILIEEFLTSGSKYGEPLTVDSILESGVLTKTEILGIFTEELEQRLRPRT
jgi:hypothetical protein